MITKTDPEALVADDCQHMIWLFGLSPSPGRWWGDTYDLDGASVEVTLEGGSETAPGTARHVCATATSVDGDAAGKALQEVVGSIRAEVHAMKVGVTVHGHHESGEWRSPAYASRRERLLHADSAVDAYREALKWPEDERQRYWLRELPFGMGAAWIARALASTRYVGLIPGDRGLLVASPALGASPWRFTYCPTACVCCGAFVHHMDRCDRRYDTTRHCLPDHCNNCDPRGTQ